MQPLDLAAISRQHPTKPLPPLPTGSPIRRSTTVETFFAQQPQQAHPTPPLALSWKPSLFHNKEMRKSLPPVFLGNERAEREQKKDLRELLQSVKPLEPPAPTAAEIKAVVMFEEVKAGKSTPEQFYKYLADNREKFSDGFLVVYNFVRQEANCDDWFRIFLKAAAKITDKEMPFREKVAPGLRMHCLRLEELLNEAFAEPWAMAQAAYRSVCDTLPLDKIDTLPSTIELQRTREVFLGRVITLMSTIKRPTGARIQAMMTDLAQVIRDEKFSVKSPEYFALNIFLLRYVNPEIMKVSVLLQTKDDIKLRTCGEYMKHLCIAFQSWYNRLSLEQTLQEPSLRKILAILTLLPSNLPSLPARGMSRLSIA